MTSRELEIFHAVMSSRSLTEAAASLGVSQPALSKALKRLEDKLRMPLFRRIKGRLHPTTEAESLFPESARLMGEIARLSNTAAELRDGESGLLRVAASSSLGISVVPAAVAAFMRAFPRVKVVSHFVRASAGAQLVARNHVDLALCLSPVSNPGTVTQSLGTVPMVCALHPDDPLAGREVIRPRDLAAARLISFGSGTYFGQLLDDAFAREGSERRIAVELATAIQAPALVLQGAGVALVDGYMEEAGFPGLAWRPFAPQVLLPVNIVTSTTRPASRLANRFVAQVNAALQAQGAGAHQVGTHPAGTHPPGTHSAGAEAIRPPRAPAGPGTGTSSRARA
ncbi:LysR family transcriptional regulator [Roseomonas elaeocarpi]|uniref:LysR family transcriptional regulator n=1 Tax=Roseomonas elaeocarpi TaxID=907779 RepID=A0ABV6JXA3_9PROT